MFNRPLFQVLAAGAWLIANLPLLSQESTPAPETEAALRYTEYDGNGQFRVREQSLHVGEGSSFTPPVDREDKQDPPTLSNTERNPLDIVGVDPATLFPQGFDLGFLFPSFSLSDELAVKPALSYSEDNLLTRLGLTSPLKQWDPEQPAPKQWFTYFGELVRLVPARVTEQEAELNYDKDIISEIQTTFINAQGQEVSFYPDPRPGGRLTLPGPAEIDPPYPSNSDQQNPPIENQLGRFRYWYAAEGNYRLENRADDEVYDADDYALTTPEGLTFEFERYAVRLAHPSESGTGATGGVGIAIRYRPNRVTDRYGNQIVLSYASGQQVNQPIRIEGKDANGAVKYRVEMHYANGRLHSIEVPAFGGGTQQYECYYPDDTTYGGTERSYTGPGGQGARDSYKQAAYEQFSNSTGNGTIVFESQPLTNPFGFTGRTGTGYNTDLLRLNLSAPATQALGLQNGTIVRLTLDSGCSGMNRTYAFYRIKRIRYRNEVQTGDPALPDELELAWLNGDDYVVGGAMVLAADVFPALEEGDMAIGNGSVKLTLDYFESKLVGDFCTGSLNYQSATAPTGTVYLLRGANLARIQQIVFPDPDAGTSRKHLFFTYGDRTVNHQEIATVAIHDEALSPTLQTPHLKLTYTYEPVQVLSGDADAAVYTNIQSPGDALHPCYIEGDCDTVESLPSLCSIGNDPGLQKYTSLLASVWSASWHPADILVEKKVEALRPDGTPEPALITHYGGSYHWDLSLVKPSDCGPCTQVKWALDGKPFNFTWEIHPDGSGMVTDLSPQGLDLDPFFASYYRRRKPFKTYRFDTGFKTALAAMAPAYHYLAGGGERPRFFQWAPALPYLTAADVLTSVQICPEYPTAFPQLYQPALFAEGFGAKCYEASITNYEPLPAYGYRLEDLFVLDAVVSEQWWYRHFTDPDGDLWAYTSGVAPCGTAIDGAQAEHFLNGQFRGRYEVPHFTAQSSSCADSNHQWAEWPLRDDYRYESLLAKNYRARTKIARLRPSFTYQAMNYDGFAWNGDTGTVAIQPADFVSGTRFSNGGYRTSTYGGTLTANSLQGFQKLDANLPDIEVGDVFQVLAQYYRVTAVNGSTIEFAPSMPSYIQMSSGSYERVLRFYRFYDPALAGYAYRGYDKFGNDGYGETFVGPMPMKYTGQAQEVNGYLVYSSDPALSLIPEFPAEKRASIEWTDANAPNNNDEVAWRFFGRVTAHFSSHALPFDDYSTVDAMGGSGGQPVQRSGLVWGLVATTAYDDGSPYPWLPIEKTQYYQPIAMPSALPPDLSNNQHPEDRITQWAWYAAGSGLHFVADPLSLKYGKPASETFHKRRDPTAFTATTTTYDNSYGRVLEQAQASFAGGPADYGTASTVTVRDLVTGLPRESQNATMDAPEWDDGSGDGRPSIDGARVRQATTFTDYDQLGRVVREYAHDASDSVGKIFGPVSHYTYTSELENHVTTTRLSTPPDPVANPQLTAAVSFNDGLGRPLCQFSQAGSGQPVFLNGADYDAAGRLERTSSSRETNMVNFTDFDTLFDEVGTEFTRYNLRGESAGVWRDPPGAEKSSSNWTFRARHPSEGTAIQISFYQDSDDNGLRDPNDSGEAVTRVNLKQVRYDVYGNIVLVEDFEDLPTAPMTLFQTADEAYSYLAGRLDGNNLIDTTPARVTAKTRADYHYDRFGKLITAVVGMGGQQQRDFYFDQFGRMRAEVHPEMDVHPSYRDFDLFDNPGTAIHGSRTTTNLYDAQGNLLETDIIDSETGENLSTSLLYRYHTGATLFPDRVHLARQTYGSVTIGYRNDWFEDTGLLERRRLLHSDDDFAPGFSSDIALQGVHPTSAMPLWLEYTYDDLGRMENMIYPSPVTGDNQRTHLEFSYPDADAVLTGIKDVTRDAVLFDDITYGPNGTAVAVTIAQPQALEHRLITGLDGFNRPSFQQFVFGDKRHERTYAHDLAGRVQTVGVVERINQTISGTGGYGYAYDSLGQIFDSEVDAMGTRFDFTYAYDTEGLGNIDLGDGLDATDKNQLPTYQYNLYGELITGSPLSGSFSMDYNPMGRAANFDRNGGTSESPPDEAYYYDPFGMRVLVHEDNGDKRLYFYDEHNMVLATYLLENGSEHWDSTSIYFQGKTAITYEHVDLAQATPPLPPGGDLIQTTPQFIEQPLFSWNDPSADSQTRYALQVADDGGKLLFQTTGIAATSFRVRQLPMGRCQSRVRPEGGLWSPWQEHYLMDSASTDLAGHYPLDGATGDFSFYDNHAAASQTGFGAGQVSACLTFDGNAQIDLTDPFRFLSAGADRTLLFWVMPAPPDKPERALLQYGTIQMSLADNGLIAILDSAAQGFNPALILTNGQWNQVALVLGSQQSQLYVGGQLAFTSSQTPSLAPGVDLLLGNIAGMAGLVGAIDEIKLYNRALSSAEISAEFASGGTLVP